MQISYTVELEERRCPECGRWWALEKGWSGQCPRCAHKYIEANRKYADEMERKNRALRGVITKREKK